MTVVSSMDNIPIPTVTPYQDKNRSINDKVGKVENEQLACGENQQSQQANYFVSKSNL